MPPVYICDECIGLCGEICADEATEPEVRASWPRQGGSLVFATIDVLNTPPAGYGEMLAGLRGLVTRMLEAVREAMAELRADRPYPAGAREPTTDEALEAAHRRAWEHQFCRRPRASVVGQRLSGSAADDS